MDLRGALPLLGSRQKNAASMVAKKQKRAKEPLTAGDIPTIMKAVLDSLPSTAARGTRASVNVTRTHSSSETEQIEGNTPPPYRYFDIQ